MTPFSSASIVAIALAATTICGGPVEAEPRGLLWRVVQTCLLNHQLTGAAFPCLAVDTADGASRGYAVVRSPLETVHVVVTPTERTIGIESARLRQPDTPDYFHDAWMARRFVAQAAATKPGRSDFALAVNSRPGRSQDQLHIHVACIRSDVKRSLQRDAATIRRADWSRIEVLPNVPHYWAHFAPSADLAGINVFEVVAKGLDVKPSAMHDITIVVVATDASTGAGRAVPEGFIILARRKIPHSFDQAHGEGLIDHDCSDAGKS